MHYTFSMYNRTLFTINQFCTLEAKELAEPFFTIREEQKKRRKVNPIPFKPSFE